MSEALKAALRPLVMEILAECRQPAVGGVVHSQRNGERPAGCGRAKFLRAWKAAHEAGDPGAWAEGRARLMTAACWSSRAKTARAPAVVKAAPEVPANDSLMAEFGARRAG